MSMINEGLGKENPKARVQVPQVRGNLPRIRKPQKRHLYLGLVTNSNQSTFHHCLLTFSTRPSVVIRVLDERNDAIYLWPPDRQQQQRQRMQRRWGHVVLTFRSSASTYTVYESRCWELWEGGTCTFTKMILLRGDFSTSWNALYPSPSLQIQARMLMGENGKIYNALCRGRTPHWIFLNG